MPQDLITAAFGTTGKEASSAVPHCKVELTNLREQVTNFEANANGDYEVGHSTVSSNAFRVQCENMEAGEREAAEAELTASLSALSGANESEDLVLLADKKIVEVPSMLQGACAECAARISVGLSPEAVWQSTESLLDSQWGNMNNSLSPDGLAQVLGLGESFDALSFADKIALGRLIKAIVGSVKHLRNEHSKKWDEKKNNKSWLVKGYNKLFGKEGRMYSDLIATKPTDSRRVKWMKSIWSGAASLVTGTESLVTSTIDFFSFFDPKADPSHHNKLGPDASGFQKFRARFQVPPALKLINKGIQGGADGAINFFTDRAGQKKRNIERRAKTKEIFSKLTDPDKLQQLGHRMRMTYQQKGLSGAINDVGHTIGEYLFVPGAGFNVAAKAGKFANHLERAQKFEKALAMKAVKGTADDTLEAIDNVIGLGTIKRARKTMKVEEKRIKAGKIEKDTLKKSINRRLGRTSDLTEAQLNKLPKWRRQSIALRKLMRGHRRSKKMEHEFDWIMSNLPFDYKPGKRMQKFLDKTGRGSGMVRKASTTTVGRAVVGKTRSSLASGRKKNHGGSGPSMPNNNKPHGNNKHDRDSGDFLNIVPLGKHRKGIEKRMKKLSPTDQAIWRGVIDKAGNMPPQLREQVFGLMAKLPAGVRINRLTDKGFEMVIGAPPRVGVVDLTIGMMFAAEAGERVNAGMENLGFSISAENIPGLQLSGALLRGTWASSSAGVGKAYQRMRGFSFEAFFRTIYPATSFEVMGAEALQGWENLQLMTNKPIDAIFADLGLMKENGTLNAAVAKENGLRIREMAQTSSRVGDDYDAVIEQAYQTPVAA